MNAAGKLVAYGLSLAAVLGVGAAVGAAAGPISVGDAHEPHSTTRAPKDAPSSDLPASGLLVSQDGYRFEPEARIAAAGEFAFTISGPDGTAVEEYDRLHDRELHLI